MTPEELKLRIKSLENTIENYRRKGLSSHERCLAAMEELNRLRAGGLEFQKSKDAIRAAAKKGICISYSELQQASGLPSSPVSYQIIPHLRDLCIWAHERGWPLITAVVVDKKNLSTCRMESYSLRGFVKMARDLGFYVTETEEAELQFLDQQQKAVFDWARSGANE